MAEEQQAYKDGDIVWVKLGNSWWPGEVINDEKRLPEDVHQMKKKPYCVVKFFKEDAYEYPKTAKQIYPFQCSKKDEFIKKGLALFNAKNAFMEKFPEDVQYAENLTKQQMKNLMRTSTEFYDKILTTSGGNNHGNSYGQATIRRDSVTTILNITPNRSSLGSTIGTTPTSDGNRDRLMSTSSNVSITPSGNAMANSTSPSAYRCNMCDFTTMRQNVLIMHRKSHSNSSAGGVVGVLNNPNRNLTTQKSLIESSSNDEMARTATKSTQKSPTGSKKMKPHTPVPSKELEVTIEDKETSRVENITTPPTTELATKSGRKKGIRSPLNANESPSSLSPKDAKANAKTKKSQRTTRGNRTTTPQAVDEIQETEKSVSPLGKTSPMEAKSSDEIRQRLLADWSDEEKDGEEDKTLLSPTLGKDNKTLSNKLSKETAKRHSPTIVPLKTLEGAGQTLIVAAATQVTQTIVGVDTQGEVKRTVQQRIRNIPKKDRLREFNKNIEGALPEATNRSDEAKTYTEVSCERVTVVENLSEPNTSKALSETCVVDDSTNASGFKENLEIVPGAVLSCFDFQEEDEDNDHANDALKSIANFKKKYLTPEKDKTSTYTTPGEQSSPSKAVKTNNNQAVELVEQQDQELIANIHNLLEQTSNVASLKDDIVKGLPIKERGKRIFKSRNRSRVDEDDDVGSLTVVATTSTSTIQPRIEELGSEVPETVERNSRSNKLEQNPSKSPINGKNEKSSELEITGTSSPTLSAKRGKRKINNKRSTRQHLVDLEEQDDDCSIPFIKHSPAHLFSSESPNLSNTEQIIGDSNKTISDATTVRSKPGTPNMMGEEALNGCSRASSRNLLVEPPTPTDETSSLGVSETGAEFGSPASLLDEERLIVTPTISVTTRSEEGKLEEKSVEIDNKVNNCGSFVVAEDGNLENGEDEAEEDDDDIESPPHEALSGNENDDNEMEKESSGEGRKRTSKTPKKKAKENLKEEEKDVLEVIAKPSNDNENKEDSDREEKEKEPNESLKILTDDGIQKGKISESKENDSHTQKNIESPTSSSKQKKAFVNLDTETNSTATTTSLRLSQRLSPLLSSVRKSEDSNIRKELSTGHSPEKSISDVKSPLNSPKRKRPESISPEKSKKLEERKSCIDEVDDIIMEDKSQNRIETEQDLAVVSKPILLKSLSNKDSTGEESPSIEPSITAKEDVEQIAEPLKPVESLVNAVKEIEHSSEANVSLEEEILNRIQEKTQSKVKEILEVPNKSTETKETLEERKTSTVTAEIDEVKDEKSASISNPRKRHLCQNEITQSDPNKLEDCKDKQEVAEKKSKGEEIIPENTPGTNLQSQSPDSKTTPTKSRGLSLKKPKTSPQETLNNKLGETEVKDSRKTLTIQNSKSATSSPLPSPTKNGSAANPQSEVKSLAPSTPSPTIEKVRINVDVANPLSSQIANILGASGGSINQSQLVNKTQYTNFKSSSALKRKFSHEDATKAKTTIVGNDDDDAVVAKVQSLCPQVKITRKERFIEPLTGSIITPITTNKTNRSRLEDTFDINKMPIVLSSEEIPLTAAPTVCEATSNAGALEVTSSLWQTEILQPPLPPSPSITAVENQTTPQKKIGYDNFGQKYIMYSTGTATSPAVSPTEPTKASSPASGLNLNSRTTKSPTLQKSPALSTGGRKQAGNTITLPSSLTVKQHQHIFSEALNQAEQMSKPSKRRSSQTVISANKNANNSSLNRRLSAAEIVDASVIATTSILSAAKLPVKSSLVTESRDVLGSSKVEQNQQSAIIEELPGDSMDLVENIIETDAEESTTTTTACTKIPFGDEDAEIVVEAEQLNNSAKITAVPIQPIPGYPETFMLCMLVDNVYKPINNVPHYLNSDQLVPVPPEACRGMLPELVVEQPPSTETTTTSTTRAGSSSTTGLQNLIVPRNKINSDSIQDSIVEGDDSSDVIASSDAIAADETAITTDGIGGESCNDNAVVLNLENQQIILDASTFEQLLANPDANTQLVTDDGNEFVLTREVLAALKAQHDEQNEAGTSGDLLSVALANSEFYGGNDVLQIETTLGAASTGAGGLQLLACDGSIVFQAPPLPQAHLTPPITAHTSETNAVLNQTPIMSTLEKPSTAVVAGKCGLIDSPIASASVVDCDLLPTVRPNLDDSLAVIGVSTQSSTVPTSLELPITITNPAIAPKVTMAAAHGTDMVQFQPHRSVATAAAAAAAAVAAAAVANSVSHIFDDPID